MLVGRSMRALFQAPSSSHFSPHTWVKVLVAILVIVKVASMASGQGRGGCTIGCFPLVPSTQPGCSLSFLCRYDLPLPPDVYLDGNLLADFKPSTTSKNATLHPCASEHCVILSVGKTIGNLMLINLSLPLLQCQSDLLLKIEYRGPGASRCRITKYENISTMGCDFCKVDPPSIDYSSDVVGTTDDSGSASPLLAICITLTILLVAVSAVAIAAIFLAVYFAREGLRMHWLACKAYCQLSRDQLQQPLLLDENRAEEAESDGTKGSPIGGDEMPLHMGDADV